MTRFKYLLGDYVEINNIGGELEGIIGEVQGPASIGLYIVALPHVVKDINRGIRYKAVALPEACLRRVEKSD